MKQRYQVTLDNPQVSYSVRDYTDDYVSNIPLLLLHGTTGDGENTYRRTIRYLKKPNYILIADYAGAGNSSLADNATIETLADQISAIIDDFGSPQVDLVGHSLGAATAAVTASKYPSKIRSLVLSAPWSSSDDVRLSLIFQTWKRLADYNLKDATAFSLTQVFTPQFLSSISADTIKKVIDEIPDPSLKTRLRINEEMNIEHNLKSITARTLVIGMEQDSLIPTYIIKDVVNRISNAKYVEISGGHAIQMENPVDWCQAICHFLYE